MSTPRAPEARMLRRVSRQTMVALPAWVRSRLGVAPGSVVYWHGHRKGEVVLARHEQRSRGPAGRGDLGSELRDVIAERDQLRQALSGHDLSERREVYAAGAMQGIKVAGPMVAMLEMVLADVRALRDEVARLPGARRRAYLRPMPSRRRRVESVTLPDEIPSPSPSPSPVLSGGDVESGGATPQATPE
jgi:bifunctional DNA-binding transcriptional regulator/antitoxin component of YhaV-PrlF toxin-antitoxin module